MSAVLRAARGGLRGRRLQAAIIGLVLLAATATSTVALGLLANAHGSFDRASQLSTAPMSPRLSTPRSRPRRGWRRRPGWRR